MSDKKPKKSKQSNISRRKFLRVSATTAGAVATGGISEATSASSVIKAGAKALPSFKIIESLISTLSNMEDIIGKITNVGIGDLQSALRGELSLPRYPAKNEYWDKIEKDRIDFSSQRKLLKTLKKLPVDQPINELLSDTVLKESSGKDGEEFDKDPVVSKALTLRKIVGPMCEPQTTSADLIGGMKSYFVKLGQHAINSPDDFVIQPVSDYPSWGQLELKDVIVRELRTYWDEYGGGRQECFVGRNDIGDIIAILEDYKKDDISLSPLINQLKQVNEAWELDAKKAHVKSENDRVAKIRAEKTAEEKVEKEAKKAERRAEEEKYERERQESLEEKKAEPDKRSSFKVTVQHVSGDEYIVDSNGKSTQVDFYQWAQSINPNLRPHHVSFEASTNILSIKNEPETATVLRELFRNSHDNGKYSVKLPNRRSGIDLRHDPDYQEKPISSQHEAPENFVELKMQSTTVSASKILNGDEILGIDFSRRFKLNDEIILEDFLTGLNNTSGIVEELKNKGRSVGGYSNDDDQITIIHFNIKRFKAMNDLYGHKEGDTALQEIAHRIAQAAEYESVIGRVDGDKFSMVYYGDRRSADDLSSDINKKLNKASPIIVTNPEGKNVAIEISVESYAAEVIEIVPKQAYTTVNSLPWLKFHAA